MNYPINYGCQHTSLFKMLKCTFLDILIGSVSKNCAHWVRLYKISMGKSVKFSFDTKFLNDVGENYRQHITATRISKY